MVAAAPRAVAQVPERQDSAWWLPPQARPDGGSPSATADDTTFIREAIRGNFTEVALGRLAESNAQDSAVKEFGRRMIAEHDSMNDRWAELARKNDMRIATLGADFGPAGKEAIDRLEDLEDREFDQAYMTEMIQDHERDLAAYQRMRSSARDPEVRQLAGSGVFTIGQHLTLARQVGSRVGVATTAGRVGGVPNPTPTYDTLRRPTGDRTARDETNARNERNELPPLRREDRAFVAGVLSDHLLHVRLARIAQRDAKMSDTRRFAERVETELTRWGGRWQRFSDRRDANVTSRLEQQDRAKLDRLRNAQEKNFDHAYAAIVANHMERMLDRFRTERWDERPGPVGRLAQDEIPVLRDLHARARVLEKQAGDRDEDSNNK